MGISKEHFIIADSCKTLYLCIILFPIVMVYDIINLHVRVEVNYVHR